VEALAKTSAMIGDHDRAVALLKELLSVPSQLSPALLRLDPAWDGLREHPGFQALVGRQYAHDVVSDHRSSTVQEDRVARNILAVVPW
jgi:hypothetical protein